MGEYAYMYLSVDNYHFIISRQESTKFPLHKIIVLPSDFKLTGININLFGPPQTEKHFDNEMVHLVLFAYLHFTLCT